MPDPTPSEPAPEPPEQRPGLWAALTKPSRAQVVVAVLLAALGFAAVTQVRSNGSDDTYAGRREQDLIDLLNGLAGASERSQSEIARLEKTRTDLQSTTRQRDTALQQARTEADALSILAGMVPVTGPGIRITIRDPEGNVGSDILLDTVEELRTAGAEAIAFNDKVRVVAQTSFQQADGGVVVDGQLLTAPYVIDVIGEPNALEGAVTFRQGPKADVEADGGSVGLESFDNLDIEVVRDAGRSQFAQPDGS